MPESSDPYLYPGTDVLRNLLDIRDAAPLAAFEANATAARLIELDAVPLEGGFDAARLKTIHRYIFQDVYSWAGEFRTVNISKGGQLFGAARFVEPALQAVLQKLPEKADLKGPDAGRFAARADFIWRRSTQSIHSAMGRPRSAGVRSGTGRAGWLRNGLEPSHARANDGGIGRELPDR